MNEILNKTRHDRLKDLEADIYVFARLYQYNKIDNILSSLFEEKDQELILTGLVLTQPIKKHLHQRNTLLSIAKRLDIYTEGLE